MAQSPYTMHLDKTIANHTPLSPLSFLARAADVYPEYPSAIYANKTFQWGETRERCTRLGSALQKIGVEKNHTVAIIAPNIPPMMEAHFGVPICGAAVSYTHLTLPTKA